MSTVTPDQADNSLTELIEFIQLAFQEGGWEAVRALAKELGVDRNLELVFAWQDAVRAAGLSR